MKTRRKVLSTLSFLLAGLLMVGCAHAPESARSQADSEASLTDEFSGGEDGFSSLVTSEAASAASSETTQSINGGKGAGGTQAAVPSTPSRGGENVSDSLYVISWNGIRSSLKGDTVQDYDALGFIASLQGLLNRSGAMVYLLWQGETDRFWYSYLSQEGKLLYGRQQVLVTTIEQFFSVFGDTIRQCGLVQWDPDVPATSNVAITACGVDGTLPVRAGGAFTRLVISKTGASVKLDLNDRFTGSGTIGGTSIASSGSAKCDAYLWALDRYMSRTSKEVMGYILDGAPWNSEGGYPDLGNAFVPNRDYLVANKAFVFDLSPWGDEVPCDDQRQPLGADFSTMKKILRAQYDKAGGQVFQVVGFVPWQQKYTAYLSKSRHGEVTTEWQYAEVVSNYNGVMDADAAGYCGLSNASLYQHYPLKSRYENTEPKQASVYSAAKKYVYIYMGDYDSAAWLKAMIPTVWTDGYRGQMPLNWAFNPNLSDRVPMVFDYVRETATDQDFFVAGDSGAGYLNPSLVLERNISGLPSGENAWVSWNQKYFTQFDLDFTGFLLNGDEPVTDGVFRMYEKFSPLGFIHGDHSLSGRCYGTMFTLPFTSDFPAKDNDSFSAEDMARFLVNSTQTAQKRSFCAFRAILWKPGQMVETMRLATQYSGGQLVFCDYKTFVNLAAQAYS